MIALLIEAGASPLEPGVNPCARRARISSTTSSSVIDAALKRPQPRENVKPEDALVPLEGPRSELVALSLEPCRGDLGQGESRRRDSFAPSELRNELGADRPRVLDTAFRDLPSPAS